MRAIAAGGLAAALAFGGAALAETGVDADSIRIGGVMDLEGRSRGLGRGMKAGIEAVLSDLSEVLVSTLAVDDHIDCDQRSFRLPRILIHTISVQNTIIQVKKKARSQMLIGLALLKLY